MNIKLRKTIHPVWMAGLVFGAVFTANAQVKVTIDRNPAASASGSFRFKTVPSPSKNDAGTSAQLTLIDGEPDPNGADISALTDGALPKSEDEPGANFFFNRGSWGGRFRMDLGKALEIAQVNTYSWHPNSRGPQLYKLYGSDGRDPKFNNAPKRGTDPATCGWKLIATVSTLSKDGEDGGQYGVSISDTSGSLGKYRYLLFDCYVTEMNDDWGNTFYSEVDVIAR